MSIDSQMTSVETSKRVPEHAIPFEHSNELTQGWHDCLTDNLAQHRKQFLKYEGNHFAQDVHIHHDSPYGDKPEATHSRTVLEDAARKRLSIPQMKVLESDLSTFEMQGAANGLDAAKVSQFYDATTNLLKSKSAHYNPTQKNSLAMELIHHAAHPEAIKQGMMQTCNVSSVECRLLVREPQAVAKLVAQVVKDGTFVTADGTKLTDNWHSIKPIGGESQRDMLDGLVQTTLVNCHWARYKEWDNDSTTYRYERKLGNNDAERVYEYQNGPRVEMRGDDHKIIQDPNLDSGTFLAIYNQVAGTSERPFSIVNGNMSREKNVTPCQSDDKCTYVNSETELHQVLTKAIADKQFPAVIAVHTANFPFRKQTLNADPNAGVDDDHFGWHSIAITKYDAATHTVKIHNSWGKEDDVNISLHQLYKATQKPDFWSYGKVNHFPK